MTAISSTTSRAGFSNSTAAAAFPHEGNYSSFLAVQEKRLLQEGKEAEARERSAGARTRMDFEIAQGPPGQIQGAHHRL